MKRTLAIITAGAVLAMPVLSLGTVHARPQQSNQLITVWEDLPTSALPGLRVLAKQWALKNGGAAVAFVNTSEPGRGGKAVSDLFPLKARSTAAPDLVYVPQDQTGGYLASGLLAPRPAGLLSAKEEALYYPNAVATTYLNGKAWSIPQSIDGLLLFYNKKLVPTPPATWDQLISTAQGLTKGGNYGFLYNITGGLYFNYWAFGGYGAYTFGTKAGKPDPTDIGLGNAGGVKALTFLQSLVTKGIVPKSADYNAPDSNFSSGKAAMIINGPWALEAYTTALGSNLGVASIPALPGGATSKPYIGVRVWEVNAYSRHQAEAWSLAKYLSMNGQAISGKFEGRLPAMKSVPGFTPSPQQVAAAKQFSVGVPIPNIPEMSAVWTPAGNAITLVIQGRSTPDKALATAVQQIKAGIAKLHQ